MHLVKFGLIISLEGLPELDDRTGGFSSSSSLGVNGDAGEIGMLEVMHLVIGSSSETFNPSVSCVNCNADKMSHVMVVGVNGSSSRLVSDAAPGPVVRGLSRDNEYPSVL